VFELHGLRCKEPNIDNPRQPFNIYQNVLNETERKNLINLIDSKLMNEDGSVKKEMDLKFTLTPDQLISLVGQSAFDKLKEVYEFQPDEIWVRRAESDGPGQGINWHVDHSVRTMQVALNGDSEYQGGRLVFANDGKIFMPPRGPGTATIHDENIVHAVTPIKSGPRYGLFFLYFPKIHTMNIS